MVPEREAATMDEVIESEEKTTVATILYDLNIIIHIIFLNYILMP